MASLFRRLREANLAALAALLILFAALLLEGANSGAGAALLTMTLTGALCLALLAAPRRALVDLVATNAIPIGAAVAFIAWSLASAAPASLIGLTPHPHWQGAPGASVSLSPYRTLEGVIAFLGVCAAFCLGALFNGERSGRDWTGRWTVLLGGLYALIGLYLFLEGRGGPRLDVAISSANVAAALFGVLFIVVCALLARAARGRLNETETRVRGPLSALVQAPVSAGVGLVLFAALLLTASRGGLIATIIAFVCFAALVASLSLRAGGLRAGAALAPFLALAALLALLFLSGGDDVMRRFALAGDDWEVRRALVDAHWRLYLERPLLGHGLNTFHELNALALTPDNWPALSSAGSAHNIFVQALEETGIVGLGLFVMMLAPLLIRACARIAKRGSGAEWAAAAIAASVLVFAHGLVDFALQTPAVAALFAFLLGAWLGRRAR